MYRDILIIGGGQRGPGIARVGGRWAEPNLGLSYLLAARHVIEAGERDRQLNEVALPAAYLQRHALEVAIKDVTDRAYVLKHGTDRLAALKTDPSATGGEIMKCRFIHALNKVLDEMRNALAAIGYKVPFEVATMVTRLGAAEADEPTRFRYLTLKKGGRSLEAEFILPVGETQDLLEDLFDRELRFNEAASPQGLVTGMAFEGMWLDQEIYKLVGSDGF
jgi:hypothetical protein